MEGVGDVVFYVCTFSYRLCCRIVLPGGAMCLRVSKMSEGRCYSRDIARPCSFHCGKTAPGGGSGSRSPPAIKIALPSRVMPPGTVFPLYQSGHVDLCHA
jgi:hypothetical protein